MPEEVQTFSKIQLLDGTVAEVRDNTKQEAPATAGQAGQVLGLDENGDPAWLDSAGSVIPVFSRGQGGYECDMTFAEVYAAIQGNECTACAVQAAPGAIVMLQLYMASETDIAFCMTTSSDTGNITSVILSFTDDENVEFEGYQVGVAYLLSKPYGRSIFPVTAGSLCYSSGSLYKAKQDIAEYEEFTLAHWQITSVEEELDALRTMYRNIIAVQDATPTSPETMIWMPATQAAGIVVPTYTEHQAVLDGIAPDYSDLTFPVSAGKRCWHDGGLYAAAQDIAQSEAWTAAHWTATTIDNELLIASTDSVVPVFSYGMSGLECDMTFAEVLAAIRANKCTACLVNAVEVVLSLSLYQAGLSKIVFNSTVGGTIEGSDADGAEQSFTVEYNSDGTVALKGGGIYLPGLFAKAYSQLTFPVAAGTLCYHGSNLLKANQTIAATENFTPAHWDATTVENELNSIKNNMSIVPVFTINMTTHDFECNMSFADVLAAVQANKCNGCRYSDSFIPVFDYVNYGNVNYLVFASVEANATVGNVHHRTLEYHSDGTIDYDEDFLNIGAMTADLYSYLTFPVAAGTYCYYRGLLWKANQTIATSEEFDSDHWDEAVLTDEISTLKSSVPIVPVFSYDSTSGDYVCDKSFAEVYAAFQAGRCTSCIYMSQAYPLWTAGQYGVVFSGVTIASRLPVVMNTLVTLGNDESVQVTFNEFNLSNYVAPQYSNSIFPVSAGDLCITNNHLYKAKVDISSYESFNSSKWDEVTVEDILLEISDAIDDIIAVQDTQPTSPNNRIWFPETDPSSVQVPTYAEYQAALSAKADKDDVEVASIAETQTIIDEWEDEEMVIEMTYVYDSGATYVCSFVSSLDADDIIAAYTAGKNVVLHLPEVSAEEKHGYNVTNNVYITLIGYQPDDETYLFNTSDGYMLSAGEDEKLHLNLYFD